MSQNHHYELIENTLVILIIKDVHLHIFFLVITFYLYIFDPDKTYYLKDNSFEIYRKISTISESLVMLLEIGNYS